MSTSFVTNLAAILTKFTTPAFLLNTFLDVMIGIDASGVL